jgi:hypothetical protein
VVTERSAARVNYRRRCRDRPGKDVEHHFEPEFEPGAEVVSAVTPDQQRNATRQLSMTSRQPGRGYFSLVHTRLGAKCSVSIKVALKENLWSTWQSVNCCANFGLA